MSVLGTFMRTIADRIVEGFEPARIVLFRSHAQGTATEWSDVDLLVIMPDVVDKRDTAFEFRWALGDLPVCKDIVIATPEEVTRRARLLGPVLRSAFREGGAFMSDPEGVDDVRRWRRNAR